MYAAERVCRQLLVTMSVLCATWVQDWTPASPMGRQPSHGEGQCHLSGCIAELQVSKDSAARDQHLSCSACAYACRRAGDMMITLTLEQAGAEITVRGECVIVARQSACGRLLCACSNNPYVTIITLPVVLPCSIRH
jgi:hypothetical protein